MKVLFLTNIPAPYRVEFFNDLGKMCDLTVSFEGTTATDRDKKWTHAPATHFTPVFLRGVRTSADSFICPGIIKLLKQKWDRIIVGGYSTPTSMLAIEYMRLCKIPFFIEADGGLIHQDRQIKYAVKRHFMSAASGWISSGKPTTEYLVHYGADPACVYEYPFSSIRDKDITEVTPAMKQEARAALGITEQRIVLFVGQFIPRKGIVELLQVAAKLPSGVGVYVVGGEPDEEMLSKVRPDGAAVHFCGFKTKAELEVYYKAADVFFLPTKEDIWGLVINEAMAYGLPIVTTDKCVAGLSLLTQEQVAQVDAVDEMAEKVNNLLRSGEEAGRRNQELIRGYTIETMAAAHMRILTEYGANIG